MSALQARRSSIGRRRSPVPGPGECRVTFMGRAMHLAMQAPGRRLECFVETRGARIVVDVASHASGGLGREAFTRHRAEIPADALLEIAAWLADQAEHVQTAEEAVA